MKQAFLVLIAVMFAGCSTYSNLMRITGTSRTWQREVLEGKILGENLLLARASVSDSEHFLFLVDSVEGVDRNVRYFFVVEYHGTEWIFQDSFRISINDVIYSFHDDEPTREVVQGNYVIERLSLEITQSDVMEVIPVIKSMYVEYGEVFAVHPQEILLLQEFVKRPPRP